MTSFLFWNITITVTC